MNPTTAGPPTHSWSEAHAAILRDYFARLDDAGIRCFVLRNHSGLPDENSSKDVDLVIEPGAYKRASSLLVDVFRDHGLGYYYMVRFERVRCWIGISLSERVYIHIDLIEGWLNKGFEFISFSELFENTRDKGGFRVLEGHYDAVSLLLYKLVGAKSLPAAYASQIEEEYKRSPDAVKHLLVRVLGEREAARVIDCIKRSDFDEIRVSAGRMTRASRGRAFARAPVRTIANTMAFLISKTWTIGIRPGHSRKFIAFEAPDGAGKTTLIDHVAAALSEVFVADISKTHVYHFRPGLLPNLGLVRERVGLEKQDVDFADPHRNEPVGWLSSLGRITYYWLDYVVGYHLCIRRDVQFDRITLFDRYAYGFLVDPRRSRLRLPMTVRSLYVYLCPKPDLVFMLVAPPDVIHARKQELTLSEIRRQLDVMQHLARSSSRFVLLDAAQSPEAMANDVVRHFVARYARRL